MKLFLFLILFLAHSSNIKAQQVSPLINSGSNDRVTEIIELNNNRFLMSYFKYTSDFSIETSRLLIYDASLKQIEFEEQIELAAIPYAIISINYDSTNHAILTLGLTLEKLIVTQYDLSLNIVASAVIEIDSLTITSVFLNSNSNLMMSGLKGIESYSKNIIIEANPFFGLIKYQELDLPNTFYPTAFNQLGNRYFLYGHNKKFHVLNSSLGIDTIISQTNTGLWASRKAFVLGTKMYLNGILGSPINIERIISIDTGYQIVSKYSKTYPNSINNAQRGFFSIDGNQSGYIFSSNTIGGCSFYNYESECENYFSIRKIDTSGVLQWEYYIGGDATYLVFHLITTSDGGCIVVFDRYVYGDTETDVYYIKFDADGNVQENFLDNIYNYTGIKKTPKIQVFLIFPNPVESILNIISSNVKNKRIIIYNNVGKIIINSELKNEIDVSFFTKGNYFYEINDADGNVLQKGKIFKD